MLFVALAGVIYLMRGLNSPDLGQKLMDPDNTLNLILGIEEKVTNWCPSETAAIELYGLDGNLQRTFTAAVNVSSLCEIMVGSFNNDGIDEKSFTKRLVAKSQVGEEKVLEQIPDKPIFRTQGLPFRSPMLLKNLADRINP